MAQDNSTIFEHFNDVTADRLFLEKIHNGITIHGAIPIAPIQQEILVQIAESAKYFYKRYEAATERVYIVVKGADLAEGQLNKHYVLPDPVVAVLRSWRSEGGLSYGQLARVKADLLLYNSAYFNQYLNGSMNQETPYFNRDRGDHLLATYELRTYQQHYEESISTRFNALTHRLQILSEYHGGDIILEVYRKIPMAALYDDDYFYAYALGKSLDSLHSMGSFIESQMPGAVPINWSMIKDRSENLISKVEERFEEEDDNPIIVSPE